MKKAINEEKIVQIEGFLKYKIHSNEKKSLMKRRSIMSSVEKAIQNNNNNNKNKISKETKRKENKKSNTIINTIITNKSITIAKSSKNESKTKTKHSKVVVSMISTLKARKLRLKRMLRILA